MMSGSNPFRRSQAVKPAADDPHAAPSVQDRRADAAELEALRPLRIQGRAICPESTIALVTVQFSVCLTMHSSSTDQVRHQEGAHSFSSGTCRSRNPCILLVVPGNRSRWQSSLLPSPVRIRPRFLLVGSQVESVQLLDFRR